MKKFFIGGLLIVCCLGALFFFLRDREESVPHSNLVDTKISLYSGRHISPNAIATDPQFSHIAFEPIGESEKPRFGNQVASVFDAIKIFSLNLFNPKSAEPRAPEYGSWLWTPVMRITPEYMESILSGAKENGVNTMYLSIDSYLDIFVMENSEEKEKLEKEFSAILESFIKMASDKGIRVDAEAGWQNWAEEGNAYKAFAVVDYIKRFNREHQYKFRGFQYDVEPYLLEKYKENPASVLKNFTKLIDLTANFLEESDLRFSVVVPDFYDKKDEMTPQFSYEERGDSVFGHLLKILDRNPDSSIIVMSYRNFAKGKDGSIEVSENEMQTARGGRFNTGIIIAQETGDFPPPYITFYGSSKYDLWREVGILRDNFNDNPNFGGIAFHYINSFLALE